MKRFDYLYPNHQTTFDDLEQQAINFSIIGHDNKNPWKARSSTLTGEKILSLTKSGIKILATPHIGLHWPSNSFYPHMGVTICDYTGNQSRLDYADEPENIKEGFSKHDCSEQEGAVLSPYLKLNPNPIKSNGFVSAKQFADSKNLAYVHHKAKRLALGAHNIILDTQLFDQVITFDFFKVLIENQSEILGNYKGKKGIFDRYVSSNGEINRCNPGEVKDILGFLKMKKDHQEMILNDHILNTEGYFPINEANIMFDAVYCYWQQIQNQIAESPIGDTYAVSGIDMIYYTKNPNTRLILDRMYKALLKSDEFKWLPKYLAHTFIPGGVFRFLPSNAEIALSEIVDHLLDLNLERISISKELSKLNKLITDNESLIDIDNIRRELITKNTNVTTPLISKAKDDFNNIVLNRRGFSQYDLLNGEFVPREIIEKLMPMTFEEIGILFKTNI